MSFVTQLSDVACAAQRATDSVWKQPSGSLHVTVFRLGVMIMKSMRRKLTHRPRGHANMGLAAWKLASISKTDVCSSCVTRNRDRKCTREWFIWPCSILVHMWLRYITWFVNIFTSDYIMWYYIFFSSVNFIMLPCSFCTDTGGCVLFTLMSHAFTLTEWSFRS